MSFVPAPLAAINWRILLLVTAIVALVLGWFCHWRVQERRYEKRGEYVDRLRDRLRVTIGEKNYIRGILERNDRRYIIPPVGGQLPPDLENEP